SNLSHLRELDLSENELKNTGVNHLCDVLKDSHCKLERLRLGCCDVTDEGLCSNPSHLRELDLSENQMKNTGVNHLCDVLKDSHCKLERLRLITFTYKNPNALIYLKLRYCDITDEGCSALTSALRSNPSHLRELDLSGNKVKNKGVKHLCDVLKNLDCKLERLSLNDCDLTDISCSALATVLGLDSSLKELNMNSNNLQDSGVKLLCTGLENVKCELEILRLRGCGLTEERCSALTSALKSNASHLRELDLSENKLGDSGFENISNLLMNPQCKLEILALVSLYCTAV
uniref:Uncharacterized protein n=1 Tax=Sinocyclocheilus grahami TaxID=75366 RepID=A0A672SSX2_SINGR